MSDTYHDFTERLINLLAAYVQVISPSLTVREADCPALMLEVHVDCEDDPVLRPEDEGDIEPGEKGPWDRRDVSLVVTLPCETGESVTAKLSFATRDADDAGDRHVSFHWAFDSAGQPGLAEMWFRDSKTFKLDYFSVMPPDYVRSFVAFCTQAFNETYPEHRIPGGSAPHESTPDDDGSPPKSTAQ